MTIKERLLSKQEYLVDSYSQGASTVKLGKEMGCSNASVYVFLRDICGIVMRTRMNILDFADQIFYLYSEKGLSGCQIANELELPMSSVRRYMKKQGWKVATQIRCPIQLDNHTDEIVQLYSEENWTCLAIAKKFQCDESTILRRLQKNHVYTTNRQYEFDRSFFDEINTEAKAYILGFAYGDSNNDGDSFRTAVTDLEICEMIKREMKYDGKIRTPKKAKPHYKQQYLISISSRELCNTLTKQGCPPNKTFKIKFPSKDIVPSNLISHFIRGVFDADGTIGFYSKKTRVCSITGTKHLLSGLQHYLDYELGSGGSICPAYPGADIIYKWSAGGNTASKKFATWLYQNATIFLKRKYDIAQEFFLI